MAFIGSPLTRRDERIRSRRSAPLLTASWHAARNSWHAARNSWPAAGDAGRGATGWLCCLLLALWSCASTALSANVDLPEIDPKYSIHVNADTVAQQTHGAYEVLAFQGNCVLRQGSLTITSRDAVLWIERVGPKDIDHPGKIICYFSGDVIGNWGDGRGIKDQQWMGRLFSVHPVLHDASLVQRYDIPTLDWSKEPGVGGGSFSGTQPVALAQFMQQNGTTGPIVTAPPLLGAADDASFGSLPPPQGYGSTPALPNQAPATPGAIQWDPNAPANGFGSTRNSELLPRSGIVIPQDGTAPYSAAGIQPPMPSPAELAPAFPTAQPQVVRQVPTASPFSIKSVQFYPRSETTDISIEPYDPNRAESVGQIKGGFRLVVNGVKVPQADGSVVDYGTVTLEADNAVVWLRSDAPVNLLEGFSSSPDRPIELYLDGNIVFSQGNRVIYADRMYYNVSSEYGMVLSAEVLTPVPQYQGLLRLKADVLQQRDSRSFKAYGAAITSSRLGVPRYWMQAGDVEFQDNRSEEELSVFAQSDPDRPSNMLARAKSNFVYVGGIPVFYWPTFSSNLKQSSFYLSSARFGNDSIFGFQTLLDWDGYQLLGIEGPEGTRLRLSTDYLSERGPAGGFRFDYERPTWFFGVPGTGFTDAWIINDSGLDILGSDRVNLQPEEELRGRLLSRQRLFLSPNTEILGESGWISDRNFLEQYYEQEWEQEKDFTSALRLRRYNGNRMFEAYGQPRVNDFFTESEWLPRLNHFLLGQNLLGDRLTWNASSSVGYGHQRVATTPTAPADAAKFALLPWETDSEGIRAATRQELSMPVSLGAWKVIPFLSGEAAFWNEDIAQDDVTRLTGQAGIRTALPFWRVYPNFENRLLDLRGIAHKMTFETELFYADSNQDLSRFPLYDPLDDNAQEHFRRRFIFDTFGGSLPAEFDERNFALRSGMQRWVTGGSTEIMDDMTQVRFGINNRWQTKRGLAGRERIVDLVSFDVDFTIFPEAERDNFGEEFGAFNYDFRYHVGDRLTLLSNGYMDVFSQGLKSISAGAQMSRPGRGDAYVGFLSLEGPISANILNGNVNYRMNEKWILSSGAAFDFGRTGNIGQSFALTRIGESALVRVGVNVDSGRDNVSFNFNIEPRFLPSGRLGVVGGELIPPAGLFGLE